MHLVLRLYPEPKINYTATRVKRRRARRPWESGYVHCHGGIGRRFPKKFRRKERNR
jgi:hypothetical protein